ncbi:O-succinylbenzoic acid--CoA ligase [Arcicella aurantiaca]|uniref:O-succinylbenzoic acid--CoA ligase n=1 Tax=Arcicella aurantiaca TaxID=591202 RepID=A0A316DQ33_9BACT|nr:AMP-binding protein [Arcicella aurantiaca]PWK18863.1 O-succinylbenzoic acid--CoA ligase [Arcicella aurantiaca]
MMQIDNFHKLPNATNEYEQKVIDFCNNWLRGQNEFVIKTSGSTGEPKPIVLSRFQMEASAKLTGKTFKLSEGDTALVCLNVEYIAGMMMLVRGMVLGLKLIITEPSSKPLEGLDIQNIDFAAFVPLQLQTLLEDLRNVEKLNQMKAIIVGGAAVNEVLENQIQQLSVPIFSTYGMTETVSHIAVRRLNGENKNKNFSVLEGVEIGLDNRNCLNIKADASNNELIQTNDIVEMIGEKEFKIIGRFDNIINSGGVKIQLEKVEKLIEKEVQSLEIKRFFTYGIPDERLGQKLILVVEKAFLEQNKIDSFLKKIVSILSKYEIPKEVLLMDKFIETPTGKVDKRATVEHILKK